MHKTKIVNPSKLFYFLISTFISNKGALVCPAPRVARKKPAPCGAGLGMVCFHLLSHIESDRV